MSCSLISSTRPRNNVEKYLCARYAHVVQFFELQFLACLLYSTNALSNEENAMMSVFTTSNSDLRLSITMYERFHVGLGNQ